MTNLVRRLSATAIAILAPVVGAIGYLSMSGAVPDPLPVHWNLHGAVDNTASVGVFWVVTVVIAAVLAAAVAAAIWLSHSPAAGRMLAALLAFGAWLTAITLLSTMLASRGASSALTVSMPWWLIPAVVLIPLLIGIGVWALLPGEWPRAHIRAAEPTIVLAAGERVVWIGHEHSTVMRVISGVLAIAGAVLLFVQPPAAIPAFIVAVATALVSELAVRVDATGVHTLWGPFGWPRPRIPLTDISAAHAELIEPMKWGGWGYRVSPRGVAAVIRRGPGLVIERVDGRAYAVTVPDADRGAGVLAALLARQRASEEHLP